LAGRAQMGLYQRTAGWPPVRGLAPLAMGWVPGWVLARALARARARDRARAQVKALAWGSGLALALEPVSVRVWVLGSVWVQALVWALLRWALALALALALAWVLVLVLVLVRERERELQQKEQALAREQAWAQATELVLEPRRPAPRCNSRSASRCHHGRHWR